MDDRRFDELARAMGRSGSRRAGLRALAGTALAGILARTGFEEAVARCFDRGERCRFHSQCCSGRCRQGACTRCNPQPKAKTCRRRCGNVRDNCRQRVYCGKCRPRDCVPTDGPCTDDDDCCSRFCDEYVSQCLAMCLPSGARCFEASDCCSKSCVKNGECA